LILAVLLTVNASASARAIINTRREQIFQAMRTDMLSFLRGQNRSRKNPDPKMVATAIPTKIL
jgi:hypothetical protein